MFIKKYLLGTLSIILSVTAISIPNREIALVLVGVALLISFISFYTTNKGQ